MTPLFRNFSYRLPLGKARRLASLMLLIQASFLLGACGTTTPADQTGLEAGDDLKLRVESAPGHAGQRLPLSHPAEVDTSRLAAVLASLQYRESGLLGRSSRRAVFSADEVQRLAPALSRGLATARPSEQVRFASFSQRGGTLGQLRKTEGVAFVDTDGRFNVAFAGIHEFAGPDSSFFDFLDLSDRDALQLERSLLDLDTSSTAFSNASSGGQRPLWVRVDLGATQPAQPKEAAAAQPAMPAATQAAAAASPAAQTAAPETARDTRPTPAPTDTASETRHQQLRQRLEFLKTLYEDGLISDEEYEQQRREALRVLE